MDAHDGAGLHPIYALFAHPEWSGISIPPAYHAVVAHATSLENIQGALGWAPGFLESERTIHQPTGSDIFIVQDGGVRAGDAATVRVLDQMGLLGREESKALEGFRRSVIRNTLGDAVGEISANFSLSSGSRGVQ